MERYTRKANSFLEHEPDSPQIFTVGIELTAYEEIIVMQPD
jgi:hypothetical protein